MTGHFVENGKLTSQVFSSAEIDKDHTSANIASSLSSIFDAWDISDKIVTIVTDNASSMKKAVNDYLKKRNHLCIAHTLNLAVKDCIGSEDNMTRNELKNEEIDSLLTKCRSIVTHFRQSTKSSNKLREIQNQMNLPELKLIQDVPTRWNATYDMLKRLIEIKIALSATITSIQSGTLSNLSGHDWKVLEDCQNLLGPFEQLTSVLSGEAYRTLSSIIPLIRGLQVVLNRITPETEEGIHLKESLSKVVHSRLDVYEKKKTAGKSTFLDPRYKKKAFGSETNADSAQKHVIEELQNILSLARLVEEPENNQSSNLVTAQVSTNMWGFLDHKVSESNAAQTSVSSATIMVKQYLELPYLDRASNPFECSPSYGFQ